MECPEGPIIDDKFHVLSTCLPFLWNNPLNLLGADKGVLGGALFWMETTHNVGLQRQDFNRGL